MNPNDQTAVLYAGAADELKVFKVDTGEASLEFSGSVTLPAAVQYAWPGPGNKHLYVVSSNAPPGGRVHRGDVHRLNAFTIGAEGKLEPHGEPLSLPARPIHVCLDMTGEHALVAYPTPPEGMCGLKVYSINADATIGEEVPQPAFDDGIHAHQVRVAPSNQMVVLPARGYNGAGMEPVDPGAVKVLRYKDGVLSDHLSIAPENAHQFGPRHVDFHPTQPWMFLCVESQHLIQVYRMSDDTIDPEPLFTKPTLKDPDHFPTKQMAGAIHVHPNGRYVYVSNRSHESVESDGEKVFAGGENSIAVYEIDPSSGEPTLIQHEDTRGFVPRAFSIDPSGRLLVVANQQPGLVVREGDSTRPVPASLAVFRIGDDGKLEFVRTYPVELPEGGGSLFWAGFVASH